MIRRPGKEELEESKGVGTQEKVILQLGNDLFLMAVLVLELRDVTCHRVHKVRLLSEQW